MRFSFVFLACTSALLALPSSTYAQRPSQAVPCETSYPGESRAQFEARCRRNSGSGTSSGSNSRSSNTYDPQAQMRQNTENLRRSIERDRQERQAQQSREAEHREWAAQQYLMAGESVSCETPSGSSAAYRSAVNSAARNADSYMDLAEKACTRGRSSCYEMRAEYEKYRRDVARQQCLFSKAERKEEDERFEQAEAERRRVEAANAYQHVGGAGIFGASAGLSAGGQHPVFPERVAEDGSRQRLMFERNAHEPSCVTGSGGTLTNGCSGDANIAWFTESGACAMRPDTIAACGTTIKADNSVRIERARSGQRNVAICRAPALPQLYRDASGAIQSFCGVWRAAPEPAANSQVAASARSTPQRPSTSSTPAGDNQQQAAASSASQLNVRSMTGNDQWGCVEIDHTARAGNMHFARFRNRCGKWARIYFVVHTPGKTPGGDTSGYSLVPPCRQATIDTYDAPIENTYVVRVETDGLASLSDTPRCSN